MAEKLPLMPKATAVWLVDNTTLTFRQIADFVGMHELEVAGIADGEVAQGIKGFDPIVNNQLTADEISRAGFSAPRLRASSPTTNCGFLSQGRYRLPFGKSISPGMKRNEGSSERSSTSPGLTSCGTPPTSMRAPSSVAALST